MKKLLGIFIVMLLIGTVVFPLANSTYKNNIDTNEGIYTNNEIYINEDCRCNSNSNNYFTNGFSIMSDPLVFYGEKEYTTEHISSDLPDYFNWKDNEGQDWTTPAKYQGNCGSCWAFAALGALESVIEIQEGLPELNPDLSEQYILSCLPMAANSYGQGCNGGNPLNAYKYINDTSDSGNGCNGVPLEICMPYQADDTIDCEEKSADWEKYLIPIINYGGNHWFNHEESTLDQIKTKIIESGSVVTGMNATDKFIFWGGYNHDQNDYYPDTQEQEWSEWLNHMVVIVGWKDDPSIDNGGYWICKNSWGTSWGYDGFFNIEYGALFTGWYTAWVDYDPENYDWHPVPKTNGPYYALVNESVQFQGDVSGEHPPFNWHWEFGDNETSEAQNPMHIYSSPGEYVVTLTVSDSQNNIFSITTSTLVQQTNSPPNKPTIKGPRRVKPGENCVYSIYTTDPDGNDFYIYSIVYDIEFGVWWGPYEPGEVDYYYHYWPEEGKYIVTAKAKDSFGAESDWAVLKVTVPKSKPYFNSLLHDFLDNHPHMFQLIRQILNL